MTFVLVHSPVVGTLTWSLVATTLRDRGFAVLTPELSDNGSSPFWRQHVAAVVDACRDLAEDEPVVLAGHSAAGLLLPAIGDALPQPVAAYLFVDAGLPIDGLSRLEVIDEEDPELGERFRNMLADGGTFPNWSEDILAPLVPDPAMLSALMRDIRPRPLAFFTEPITVPERWPDAPCGVLQFGDPYDRTVARIDDWPVIKLDAGHFHQLVDPEATVDAMLELLERMGVS